MTTVEERAKAGAAFLDERLPGWRDKVDPDALDLRIGCGCVLGQLFGQYERGQEILGLTDMEAETLGFYKTSRVKWLTLTNAWRRLLR